MAQPRSPSGAVPARGAAQLDPARVDAVVSGRTGGQPRSPGRHRPRDDVLLRRHRRPGRLLRSRRRAAQRGAHAVRAAAVERGVYSVRETNAAPRIKIGADVLPWWPASGVYLLVEQGHAPATGLIDVPGVAGTWSAVALPADPDRHGRGRPTDHLLLPRRRSGRHRRAAPAGARAAVERHGRDAAARCSVPHRRPARLGSPPAVKEEDAMRVGLMIGSDKERSRSERVAGLIDDARDGRPRRLHVAVAAADPRLSRCHDRDRGDRPGHAAHRARHRGRADPDAPPDRDGPAGAHDAGLCAGRFTLGLGPSHHWIVQDQLGLPYERPAALVRDYLQVLNAAFAGPGPVDVENDSYRVHSPLDVIDAAPMPILIAALAPVMLRIAGEHTSGTILWMADERAIGEHVVPRITKAASAAGRRATANRRGRPGRAVRQPRGRCRAVLRQRDPRPRPLLTELRTAARAR